MKNLAYFDTVSEIYRGRKNTKRVSRACDEISVWGGKIKVIKAAK